MASPSILVIDDDIVAAELLSEVLTKEGYSVTMSTDGQDAVRMGEASFFDIVITDLKMPEFSGIDVLNAFKRLSPQTIVFVITAFGSFETAINAIQNGAYDYMVKPFKIDEIKTKVKRCIEQHRVIVSEKLAHHPPQDLTFKAIIGSSTKMLEVYKTVAMVASSDAPVLIMGESGTGKELIARALHENSPRADKPYVVVNCATFPENLLESELFGHVKGAFTNALMDKKGLFEEADGGTCFLDEIGDMPISLQVKLLRVLQTSEIRRIGGTTSTFVNVRFVAATNKHLPSMVKSKEFREDLFYRLHVITINLPPLRDHLDDIPLLAEHFFRKAVAKSKKDVRCISNEAMEVLSSYHWPGNIRQLENTIERAIALTSNKALLVSDIPAEVLKKTDSAQAEGPEFPTLAKVKLEYIEQVLRHTNGNQKLASEILGVDRKTLYRLMKNK